MPSLSVDVRGWVDCETPRFVKELQQFLRIPSVSGDASRAGDVHRCGQWLAAHLRGIGMQKVWTSGPPARQIVFAELIRSRSAPWVLIYGHYDVQPEGNHFGWHNPPFAGVVECGAIWGRGASDNKGQLLCQLKALEYLLRHGGLQVNVRCCFEAEEEYGSGVLLQHLRTNPEDFRTDVVLISDTAMSCAQQPSLVIGLRGNLALSLELHGFRTPLHSGTFGGAVLSPAQAMAGLLAEMHDQNGRVRIPGFYADVLRRDVDCPASSAARKPVENQQFYRRAGSPNPWGDPNYSPIERATIRPAIIVQSLQSGSGTRTSSAIPTSAKAALSIRLVPNQCPRQVFQAVTGFLKSVCPPQVRLRVQCKSVAAPLAISPSSAVSGVAARALRSAFRAPAVKYRRSGGSIPVVSALAAATNATVVLMGYGLATDRIHSANEHFRITQLQQGIIASSLFLSSIHRVL